MRTHYMHSTGTVLPAPFWDMRTCSPTDNTALPVHLPTWGECPPRTCEFVYLSLQYALKCDGRANSSLVWVML